MSNRLTRFDGGHARLEAASNGALAAAALGQRADLYASAGVLAAVQGDHYWTSPELSRTAKAHGSAKALADGYVSVGPRVLDQLHGRFSLAIILERQREVFLATDRLGTEPVTYLHNGESFIFASTPAAILQHPSAARGFDPQALYNYVYFLMVPGPNGVFEKQVRLLPGSYALLRGNHLTTASYWEMEYDDSPEQRSFQDLKGEFLEITRASVRQASLGAESGAFLSGGTDSSTVAGVLGETLGRPAPTYSIGFEEKGYDEMQYARIAARHFNTAHHEYYLTPDDVVSSVPEIADVHAEPFGNSSAVPAYYCARMARQDGMTRLLAGDGGDELFAGNSRYATQRIFAVYDKVPSGLRRGVIEPIVRSGLFSERILPLYKIRRYVEQASIPMPERYERYNLLTWFGAEQVFEPDFLGCVDAGQPLGLLEGHYQNVQAESLVNKMLGLDLKFTLTDNDLPKVNRACEYAGIEVAYPLLADDLVAFSAGLSPKLKLKGMKLRYFFKEALRDFLPVEIIHKKKQGFGLPFGPWTLGHPGLRDFVRDSLNNLKRRQVVQVKFVDALLDEYLPTHGQYYGAMVWALLMLEHWFQRHVDHP